MVERAVNNRVVKKYLTLNQNVKLALEKRKTSLEVNDKWVRKEENIKSTKTVVDTK